MKRAAAALLAVGLAAHGAAAGYYTYVPQEATREEALEPPAAAIGVEEIVIARGDTLSSISRRYSGKSHYYPQLLLFNAIADPDLIYAGKSLRVPLTKAQAAKKQHKQHRAPKAATHPPVLHSPERAPAAPPAPAPAVRERRQAEEDPTGAARRDIAAHRYADAVRLLESFVATSPSSPAAAEATLLLGDAYEGLARGK